MKEKIKRFYRDHHDQVISFIGIIVGVTMLLGGVTAMGVPLQVVLVISSVLLGAIIALISIVIFFASTFF